MNRRTLTGTVLLGAWTTVWVVLWRDLSAANVISGAVVALGLLVAFPPRSKEDHPATFRPVAGMRFLWVFAKQFVKANLVVAWEVVTPRNRINEGIIAIPIRGVSRGLITLVANAISLAPGTLTLDTSSDPNTLYVHVLHLHDIDAVRHSVQELERLAIEAFGPQEAVGQLEVREGEQP